MTLHSRHEAKYLDVQLIPSQGFVFTEKGKAITTPIRTLKDFVAAMKSVPKSVLDGHAGRGDFSRWIANVFHDHALAADIRSIEQQHCRGNSLDLTNVLARIIHERC
jgi:hypothetical protein